MKNLKKQTKFKLEYFEVAKLKNAKKIVGGGETEGQDTRSRRVGCITQKDDL
jgi:hypothetical protein